MLCVVYLLDKAEWVGSVQKARFLSGLWCVLRM